MIDQKISLETIAYPNGKVLLTPKKAWKLFCIGPEKGKSLSPFKVVEARVPFSKELIICDIKMADPEAEDEIFEQNPLCLYNLRRGLSYLMTDDVFINRFDLEEEEEEKKETRLTRKTTRRFPGRGAVVYRKKVKPPVEEAREPEIPSTTSKEYPMENVQSITLGPKEEEKAASLFLVARKGLYKFFDISPEWFAPSLTLPHDDNKANYLFWPLSKHLEKGGKIELVATRKINGENAQVSYISSLDLWCVASKNVTLCAKVKEDVGLYKGKRYSFAKEFARTWFGIIEKLHAKKVLDQFKNEIAGKTMVGEYVGNPEHQHMVRYPRETIMFYAIVENDSLVNCIDPVEASKFFEKYELDHVYLESKGIYSSFIEVAQNLSRMITEMATESIYNEEEGVVVYTVARGLELDYTISLCKVKTLEYRIYRKIRETTKNQLRNSFSSFTIQINSIGASKAYNIFCRSCDELVQNIMEGYKGKLDPFDSLPMPYEYYRKIAYAAFEYAEYLHHPMGIYKHYTDFIGILSFVLQALEECIAYVDSQVIGKFLKAHKGQIIILLSPPFYTPETAIEEIKEKYGYFILNDIVSPAVEVSKISVLHLYTPPQFSKDQPYVYPAVAQSKVILAGYRKEGLEFGKFVEHFHVTPFNKPNGQKKLKETDGKYENLCKRDRNMIKMQNIQMECVHKRNEGMVKEFIERLDKGGVPITFVCNVHIEYPIGDDKDEIVNAVNENAKLLNSKQQFI
eukprot:TRINITY_DN121771_c0_g1_i1.p1 TRINITY_DN121771_c0_g1~~TRINITY_DN121771_c0_g1_i1.p1  ORF type:complete len:763 (-),score=101.55 TRINITY_DN121771_c0_g1_i1:73-2292(-)